MALKNTDTGRMDTIFASVLADGKIHVGATEHTEGAVKREYETSDGKSGEKWELLYTELSGTIEKVSFFEGNYGKNLQIVVRDDEDESAKPITLSIPTESNFGEDVMKKLPNINQKKVVTFAPYSFLDDKGKRKRGVTVTQESKKGEVEKIQNFYYDAKIKEVANGYPEVPKPKKGKALTKSDWRKYFGNAREFLIEDLTERLGLEDEEAEKVSDLQKKAKKEAEDF